MEIPSQKQKNEAKRNMFFWGGKKIVWVQEPFEACLVHKGSQYFVDTHYIRVGMATKNMNGYIVLSVRRISLMSRRHDTNELL